MMWSQINMKIHMILRKCSLNAWKLHARGPHEHKGSMLIYECCVQHVFQCLNTDFVGSTNTINTSLILLTFTVLFL